LRAASIRGISELDTIDLFAIIPSAFVNKLVETDMALEFVFGNKTLPVGEDLLRVCVFLIPVGIRVGR
jgi:hypothetical protein